MRINVNNKAITLLLMSSLFVANAAYCANEDVKERYNIYYNNAVQLFKDKKYTSSINEFKKVLRFVPYDNNVKNALYTAYVARAEYFLNTEKQPKKAINDLRSALFYMKYWSEDTAGTDAAKISAIQNNLNQLLKKYENLTADAKFQNAKNLRANGEIAAAGYEFNQLKGNAKYKGQAENALFDIYKSLNNQRMALESVRAVLKINPKDAMAHYKYALLLDDIGNYNAADDEYSLAFQYSDNNPAVIEALKNLWTARSISNPKDAQALINLGALFQKSKQYDLAKAQYLKAQSVNPNDPVVLTNLASLYLETKDYKSALDTFDTMIAKNPADIKPLFYKADAYRKMCDNNNAIAQYKRVLELQSDNIEAKDGINSIVSNLKGAELTAYLKSDADTNPYDYDKQFNYAFELHKNKAYPDAIAYYKKAIAINPNMPEPYINIAQIYRLQNDTQKADAAISHGLSNLPDNKDLLALKNDIQTEEAAGLYNSALNAFNSGNYPEALNSYLKIKIQTPEVLYSIASCYFELGENEKAIEYFKKVLEKTPNDTKAMYFIANSYVNLQNSGAAIEYLNKILKLEPANADAKNALASLKQGQEGKDLDTAISLYENKKYTECLTLLDKIISANPSSAYAHYYKGAVFDETNKKDEAISEYKKAINADSDFALAYYMLAVNLDNKELYKEAVPYYDKYLALKSKDGVDDDYSKYVKSRVKELKDYLGQKQPQK